jgi:quercetin dioxygenase-like cupin family protein
MRGFPLRTACVAASTVLTLAVPSGQPVAPGQPSAGGIRAAVVLDNQRVRVFKTTGPSLEGVEHRAGVVVPLEDGPARTAGAAYWAMDAGAHPQASGADAGSLVIVEPKDTAAPPPPAPEAGSKPGGAAFTGMSFRTLFENDKVTVIRARMEVDAREGFHTHGADTLVVHLSGGTIEDTANGTTTVNRWKRGDVEFEGRGSAHSARNTGPAVDVVLVALKP